MADLSTINGDVRKPISVPNITADAIAHQLLLNGKPDQNGKICNKKPVPKTDSHETILTPFTIIDLGDVISLLKNSKPGLGLDNIHHGNDQMLRTNHTALALGHAQLVALVKPRQDPERPKSYRPIALFCSPYKLLERMILTRLQCKIEHNLIRQQAGYRPRKSCCSQVLNLTHHIEDGFDVDQITGEMANRVDGETSEMAFHKAQYVLPPQLFNVYTNDQPFPIATNGFIYADDMCLTVQQKTFEQVETTLASGLNELSAYYKDNNLRPNHTMTQSSNGIPSKESPSRPLRRSIAVLSGPVPRTAISSIQI